MEAAVRAAWDSDRAGYRGAQRGGPAAASGMHVLVAAAAAHLGAQAHGAHAYAAHLGL